MHFLGARDEILLHPLSGMAMNAILVGLVAGIPINVSESTESCVYVVRAGRGLIVPDMPWH